MHVSPVRRFGRPEMRVLMPLEHPQFNVFVTLSRQPLFGVTSRFGCKTSKLTRTKTRTSPVSG